MGKEKIIYALSCSVEYLSLSSLNRGFFSNMQKSRLGILNCCEFIQVYYDTIIFPSDMFGNIRFSRHSQCFKQDYSRNIFQAAKSYVDNAFVCFSNCGRNAVSSTLRKEAEHESLPSFFQKRLVRRKVLGHNHDAFISINDKVSAWIKRIDIMDYKLITIHAVSIACGAPHHNWNSPDFNFSIVSLLTIFNCQFNIYRGRIGQVS